MPFSGPYSRQSLARTIMSSSSDQAAPGLPGWYSALTRARATGSTERVLMMSAGWPDPHILFIEVRWINPEWDVIFVNVFYGE